jgi:anti-sigma28 factor (negative regulator of flagellin synthesis)
MRIGDFNAAAVNPAAGQAAEKLPEEAGRPPNAAPDDAVALSRLSQAIAEPGPSEARLEQLRTEVEAGAYRIAAKEIATKIVDSHGD